MKRSGDCGRPELVTPTLEQLLGIARGMNLPTVKVRERTRPPARVSGALKGWLAWQLVDRRGREVRAGEGPNLILDQGLDLIATTALVTEVGSSSTSSEFTHFPLMEYAAVGTNSASPSTSDTGLGSEVARTKTRFADDEFTRSAPGVYQITRHIEFDYDEGNGNLTEWGFSNTASAGANLFNRALFTDSGGDPDTVTKTDQEKLRLSYTLEVSLSPVSLTAGSFDIIGVGTVNGDYTLIGGAAPNGTTVANMRCIAPDLKLFSAWARGTVGVVNTGSISQPPVAGTAYAHASDLSGVTYTDEVAKTNDVSALVAPRDVEEARDAYTPGSFTRTGGAWRWDTAYANLDPIRGFYVQGSFESFSSGSQLCGYAGYAFDLDPGDVFSKDDEHALTIGVPTVTWGRAS